MDMLTNREHYLVEIITGLVTSIKRGNAKTHADDIHLENAERVLANTKLKTCLECERIVDNPRYDLCSACDRPEPGVQEHSEIMREITHG